MHYFPDNPPNIPVNFTSADNNVVYLNYLSKEASMVLLAVAVNNFHKTISASDFHMDNKQADELDKKFSEYLNKNKNINIYIYDEQNQNTKILNCNRVHVVPLEGCDSKNDFVKSTTSKKVTGHNSLVNKNTNSSIKKEFCGDATCVNINDVHKPPTKVNSQIIE
jgi:hypothetical protein